MTIVGHGPRNGFKVRARSTADIREHAARLRHLFGVNGPRFDAEKTLEGLSRHGVCFDVVDDRDSELPRGVEACWVPDTVTLTVRESVYAAACRGESRALFTIAHELGHLALAHRRTFNRDASMRCEVYEDSEWQADTFAAEFLMPLDQIRAAGLRCAEDLVATFGVSRQAAETRVHKLRRDL